MATAGVLLVTIIVFMVLCQLSAALRSCPVVCHCTEQTDTGLLTAYCEQDDLWYVPSFSNMTTYVTIRTKKLASLEDFAFENARLLAYIQMASTSLKYISAQAFDYLPKLQSLSIKSRHSVGALGAGVFNLGQLSTLVFEGNLTKLPTEYMCHNHNLTPLYIRNNWIMLIRFQQCAEQLQELRTVDISGNPLQSVDKMNFFHLRTVMITEIRMSNCGLRELPSDLFQYTPYLKSLNLNDNKITILEPITFRNLTNLASLGLARTLLHTIPLQENNILMMNQLDLRYCKYMNISFDVQFRKATRLRTLLLDSTSLGVLDQDTFANLATSNIRYLSLQQSKIHKVSVDSLKPLIYLEHLDMTDNPTDAEVVHNVSTGASNSLLKLFLEHTGLSSLDDQVFSGFSRNNSLATLVLSKNKMTMIKHKAFATLNKLTSLDLSDNSLQVSSLHEGAFEGLLSLQKLVLVRNEFDRIPNLSIVGKLLSLQLLDIGGNSIGTIGSFEGYDALTSLNLRNNHIKHIENGNFYSLKKLDSLYLHQNKITQIDELAFGMLTKLTSLRLDQNSIGSMNGSILLPLKEIEHLDFNYNRLLGTHTNLTQIIRGLTNLNTLLLTDCRVEVLPIEMFIDNGNLITLGLGHNSISSWDAGVFKSLKKLEMLILANNQITSMNHISFKFLVSLKQLDLSGNPLACTCDLLWFKHWINTADLFVLEYTNIHTYSCASPDDMKGVPLMDFTISPNDCSSKTVLHLTVSFMATITVVCITAALVYRKKWYLRYYMFLMSSRRRQMRDATLNEDAFQYDVFVCYHHTSRHWIINSLLPELEYKGGLKLCIHDRDWIAGPYILDNIVESLDRSRKTLLLINNEFAKSAWCREEMSLAYHRFVEEQRNMLVVVLMENIETRNINKTLRIVLTSHTYLDWQQGVKKETKFWKALRRSLRKTEHSACGIELGQA